jgi:hypothetical protein
MENEGIFFGNLEYFTVIWYILWPFGNAVVILYIFPRFFGILCQEKSGNPGGGRETPSHTLGQPADARTHTHLTDPIV